MAGLLAAAALVVGYASVLSLLAYVPLLAVAESIPTSRWGRRAGIWLFGLLLPPAIAVALAAWGLARHASHPLFSPHAGRLRPHLCLHPLVQGPEGAWRAWLFSWLCLLLLAAAVLLLVGGLTRGVLQGRALRREARRREALPAAPGVELRELEAGALASHRSLGPRVVYGPALERLFPEQQAAAILAHEVCHAARRDNLWGTLAAAALPLQALSPAAYLCLRNWLLAREIACDRFAAEAVGLPETVAALHTARELTEELEELSPLSPPGEAAQAYLELRLRHLHALAERPGMPAAAQHPIALVFGLLTVAALGVIAAASLRQLPDTVHCAAEALLQALGRG